MFMTQIISYFEKVTGKIMLNWGDRKIEMQNTQWQAQHVKAIFSPTPWSKVGPQKSAHHTLQLL